MSFRQLLHHFSSKLSDTQPCPLWSSTVASKFLIRTLLHRVVDASIYCHVNSIEVKCCDVPRSRSNSARSQRARLDTTSINFRPIRRPSLTKGLQTYPGVYMCRMGKSCDVCVDFVATSQRGIIDSIKFYQTPTLSTSHWRTTNAVERKTRNRNLTHRQDFGWKEVQVAQGDKKAAIFLSALAQLLWRSPTIMNLYDFTLIFYNIQGVLKVLTNWAFADWMSALLWAAFLGKRFSGCFLLRLLAW